MPGYAPASIENNGYISSSITFKNPSLSWLTGVEDNDEYSLNNWLRTGSYNLSNSLNGAFMGTYTPHQDINDRFSNIINGTWGPYCLANRENSSTSRIGIRYFKSAADFNENNLKKVASVDIVFTNDRSKWSRCVVAEMNAGAASALVQTEAPFSENGAFKYTLRRHASLMKEVDKNGQPQYDVSEMGRSWFPGYAINQETGERLNIIFGEDSGDPVNNGRDMIWNPTSVIYDESKGGLAMWGGHHIIYIMNTRYDECNAIYNELKYVNYDTVNVNNTHPTAKQKVWRNASWVSPALLQNGFKLFSYKEGVIPTETRVKIRVASPYNRIINTGVAIENVGFPVYQFNLNKMVNASLSSEQNEYHYEWDQLLDRINITPNPYYAHNAYGNALANKTTRIINLPQRAEIDIFDINGTFIKHLVKNNTDSFVDWDLTNSNNRNIASGMYLLHIKIFTELGMRQKVLKWYGVMAEE